MKYQSFFILFIIIPLWSAKAQNTDYIIVDENSSRYLAMDELISNYAIDKIPFYKEYISKLKIKSIELSKERGKETNFTKYTFNKKGNLSQVKHSSAIDKDVEIYTFNKNSLNAISYNQSYKGEYIDMDYDVDCIYKGNRITSYKQKNLLDGSILEDRVHESKAGNYIFIKDDAWVTKCVVYLNETVDINDTKSIKKLSEKIIISNNADYRRGVLFLFYSFKNKRKAKLLKFNNKVSFEEGAFVEDYYYNKIGLLLKKEKYYLSKPNEKRFNLFKYNGENMPIEVTSGYGKSNETKLIFSYSGVKIQKVEYYHFNRKLKNDLKAIIKYKYEYF